MVYLQLINLIITDDTNKLSDTCDQDSANCTCFNFSSSESVECGCSLGYNVVNESDSFICQGENNLQKSD